MSEEAVKPNLEVVPPTGGTQENLGDMGGQPQVPKVAEVPSTKQQEADARASLLDAMGVQSVEELNYVLDVAKVGHQALLKEAEKAKAEERSTAEGQAKQRGRVDFMAKYGEKLVVGAKGQLLVPADVLQEAVDDMKEEARRIAREESEQTVKGAENKKEQIRRDDQAAYNKFWNDPKNSDLVSGTYINDDGTEISAAAEVNALVDAGVFKPSQAALHVREKMKFAKKAQEAQARSTERSASRYEENWNEEIDVKTLPRPVREAKTKLDDIKRKPEGERGSDSFFDMFESSRRWS